MVKASFQKYIPVLQSKSPIVFQRSKATGETDEAANTKIEDLHIEEPVEEVKTDGVFTVKISSVPTTSSGDGPVQGEQKLEVQKKFVPHPRMSACLAMKHGILYLYGGIFESGKISF